MKISIVGVGMVGAAVRDGSLYCHEVCTFDKFKPELTTLWDRAWATDLCFVCVPTPVRDGVQDCSEVVDACMLLRGMSTEGYKGVVVIKSTVLPGTMKYLSGQFPELRFVHNPEFLCERTAAKDYANQSTILLSGNLEDVRVVRKYADLCLTKVKHAHISEEFEVTEYAKFIHNCALPVKISFLNEIYNLIGDSRIFNAAIDMAKEFGNLGDRNGVPGPDGKFGWAGMCFVKDTLAMSAFAKKLRCQLKVLDAAIAANKNIRPGAYDGTENCGITGRKP